MQIYSALMTVMEKAARKAARGLARDFGEVEQLQVSRKGPSDFVSTADFKAEKILREELTKARPTFGLLMEESGATPGTEDSRWIVDPLDGTTNFLHGIPHFAISIAVEKAGEIVAGLVLDPIRDEFFRAEKGKGAFLNQRRLRVSGRSQLGDAVIATGIPYRGRDGREQFVGELETVMAEVAGVRRFGAAALDLAYVAAGRYDGFWERGLAPWDVAAGVLMVREAGGYVTGIGGKGDPVAGASVLAANDRLHGSLDRLVSKGGHAVAAVVREKRVG
ncbi:MAG: inositol monophosphatase [Alphaproteobacteria bacterium]|nr:inositol monophosphatase [Alphaproteobacteria bacterium]